MKDTIDEKQQDLSKTFSSFKSSLSCLISYTYPKGFKFSKMPFEMIQYLPMYVSPTKAWAT